SDHFIREENTQTGSIEDVRWREAKAWTSYAIKTNPQENVQLYVKYLEEENRKTNIFINDTERGKLEADLNTLNEVKTAIIPIPETLNKNSPLQVKIATDEGATSHKILEIRVIKEE